MAPAYKRLQLDGIPGDDGSPFAFYGILMTLSLLLLFLSGRAESPRNSLQAGGQTNYASGVSALSVCIHVE